MFNSYARSKDSEGSSVSKSMAHPMPVPPFPATQFLIDGDRFRMESPEARPTTFGSVPASVMTAPPLRVADENDRAVL